MKKSFRKRLEMCFLVILIVFFAAFLGYLHMNDNIEEWSARPEGDFLYIRNPSCKEVEKQDTPLGVVKEYQFSLKESMNAEKKHGYLCFQADHQYVDVYIEQEHIYSLKKGEDISNIKTTGSNWVMIPIYEQDYEKTVTVVITPVYESVRDEETAFMIGDALSIVISQMKEAMPEYIMSIIVILMGLFFLCISGYYMIMKEDAGKMVSIALCAIIIGIWRLTDIEFTSFFYKGKPIAIHFFSLSMLMICMIPLLKSIKSQFNEKGRKIVEAFLTGILVTCIFQIGIQFMGIMDLREMLIIPHTVLIICAVLLLGNSVYKMLNTINGKANGDSYNTAWILGLGLLLDLFLYYIKGTSRGLFFTLIAIFCYVLVGGARILFHFNDQKKKIADYEMQLIHSQIATTMSQIRSHFVFNVLNAISGMCKYDPEKADRTIVSFARFLRNNIDIMEEDKPVSFAKALQHLEDFVLLQQIRFGEKIQFATDIAVDNFLIPPLILQPIVENSIKHGLNHKKMGGTITLRTLREGDIINVIVEDDGVGFDLGEEQKEKAVGLKNVRFRLYHLMKGSLKIESEKGKGTKVTISIPYKEAEECI